MCRNSMLFDFCKILKTAAISFVLAGMFMFSSYAYAGENPTSGDPEGITDGWAVSSPESSQPIETYIMACTNPGIPGTITISDVSYNSAKGSWVASSCSGCTGSDLSITYYWSVGTSSTHTYLSGYTARDTTTGLTASVTGLACGTTYYMRVYANNGCGSSDYKTSSAFTTSGNPTAPTSAAVSPSSACSGTSTIY
ncbi:MAG: fibronectin type III domain-containing protein, partial [Bacteroidales bacterium]|nr:fibronectin type III domain-containing protein [Bacteroidales bacterium]